MWRTLLPLIGLMFLVGCSTPKYTFQVDITNTGPQPLAAGLIKHAPQMTTGGLRPSVEEGWAAPEDVAIHAPALAGRHWGVLIPPGETRTVGPQEGTFRPGVTAGLRVYVGNRTVEELTAFSRTDPDRVDIPLMPGHSAYVVSQRSGRLVAEPR